MEDVDIRHKPEINKKDFASTLASEILMKIFGYLQLDDVMKLSLVCKRWDSVSCSDELWGKFVPKYPDVELPKAKSQKEVFQKLWSGSVEIGKERWFPNPLPGLVKYNSLLQMLNEEKSLSEMYEVFSFSKCMLYLRLNPLYPFTTDGIKCEDPLMQEIVHKISDELGHIPRPGYECDETNVPDGTALIDDFFLTDRKNVMKIIILFCLDFETKFLYFWDKQQLVDEEGLILEKNLNDDEQLGIVPHVIEKGMGLNKRLFNQIRSIFVEKNYSFIAYNVKSRYRNEIKDLPYGRQFLVSDTAIVYCASRRFARE